MLGTIIGGTVPVFASDHRGRDPFRPLTLSSLTLVLSLKNRLFLKKFYVFFCKKHLQYSTLLLFLEEDNCFSNILKRIRISFFKLKVSKPSITQQEEEKMEGNRVAGAASFWQLRLLFS